MDTDYKIKGVVEQKGDTSSCFHRKERRSKAIFKEGKKYYLCGDCFEYV